MATTAVRCHIYFRKNPSSIIGHLGRLVKLIVSLQVQTRRLDREFHVLCPTLAPLVYPPSLQGLQQKQCPTAGRRHQRDASSQITQEHQPSIATPLGSGFTSSKSLTNDCRECHNPNLNFDKIPTHFDEHVLSPSCSGKCQHEVERKTILVSLHSNSDPAPDNFRSLAGS